MSAAEYVFLHSGGCLVETPELEISPAAGAMRWRWVATLWRDADRPDGWNALVWERAERGWWLPTSIVPGDIIEFGASAHDDHGGHGTVTRWWGWIERMTAWALVVVGPYDHPMRALEAARPTVDEIRLAQLVGPAADALLAVGDTDG